MPKREILRKKQLISFLFRGGKSLKGDFLRIVYASPVPERFAASGAVSVMFAVSKKNLPSAVHRNRAKRMMREAWRLERPLLSSRVCEAPGCPAGRSVALAIIYTGRNFPLPSLEAFRSEAGRLLRNMKLT